MSTKILYETLKNDKNLAKNVILLSYRNVSDLKDLFVQYEKGKNVLYFGIIRIALNLGNQLRNR